MIEISRIFKNIILVFRSNRKEIKLIKIFVYKRYEHIFK